uniref:Uncharacterized protein n=1 Tax=Daphnia galeata TaxID=27404 RepID=A0A8J2RQT0_9CRUS|nr:unnamed protein product [Daphnia galeata]
MKFALFGFSVCLLVSLYNPLQFWESGVRVTDAAKAVIDKIKAGKEFRYRIFFVKNETVIDIESKGSRTSTYDEYLTN